MQLHNSEMLMNDHVPRPNINTLWSITSISRKSSNEPLQNLIMRGKRKSWHWTMYCGPPLGEDPRSRSFLISLVIIQQGRRTGHRGASSASTSTWGVWIGDSEWDARRCHAFNVSTNVRTVTDQLHLLCFRCALHCKLVIPRNES